MQRRNRSAHAPVGAAFFLFLGLAIVPVSLRAAGVQVSFSPRLAAAMDAWRQIAESFGASYQPAPVSALWGVRNLEGDPANPIESPVSAPSTQLACSQNAEQLSGAFLDVPKTRAPRANCAPSASNRSESRRSAAANRVALLVAAEALKASFEKDAPSFEAPRPIELQTALHELIAEHKDRRIFRRSFEHVDQIRNLPVPKSVRVMVRMKRAAAGFSATTTECKVSAALDAAQRRESDRATVTGIPSATPDNGEF